LQIIDILAMSPLLIVLFGASLILLLEAFFESFSSRFSSWITCLLFVVATIAAWIAPESSHPALVPWLSFDALSRFFTIFFLYVGLVASIFAMVFFYRFKASQGEYYFLLFCAVFGLLLIGSAADFLTLFLGLETLSITLYIMCGYMKGWSASQEAAMKYVLIGSLAISLFLYGVAFVYGATGSTSFAHLLDSYSTLRPEMKILFVSGISLITVGLAFKAAAVPFHTWAPDVYDGSTTPVAAFMAVGTKAGAFAALTRIFLLVLPNFSVFWKEAISVMAIVTLVYGNFVAMRQKQLRRFFAYSGISQTGFLLLPFVSGSEEAIPAVIFYLVIYSLATFGCFAVLVYLEREEEGLFMDDLKGLFYHFPWMASFFSLCLLTLAGLPPTLGFFAKLAIFKVAFESGYYSLVSVGLLATVLSAYYYIRVITTMLSTRVVAQF
jgi:NADH-quinone oxidoreductase subunit N